MNTRKDNPTVANESAPAAKENISSPSSQLTNDQLEAAKIFLIDDEPIILELFEVYLREAGFQNIFPFTDSVEAVETLRFVTPSIILTDINMPEVSGNFLIKLIRTFEHLQKVPIVAVTSNTTQEARETILRKGADAVIHKPVDGERLIEKVSQALRSTIRLEQQLSDAAQREQQRMDKRKAELRSFESNLRDLMR